VLFNFNSLNGAFPQASLLALKGKLYGTTEAGGKYAYSDVPTGTVFALTIAGQQHTLVNFRGTDGGTPMANVVALDDVLYGTTEYGGKYTSPSGTCGTVFKVTPSGKHSVLYNFDCIRPSTDGYAPTAGLVPYKGVLYGTTTEGGAHGAGTVYSITPDGKERVVYSFAGGHDGGDPAEGLIVYNDEFYGATPVGGAYYLGTIFAVSPSGKKRIVYSFKGTRKDGILPNSVIEVDGKLYGTTYLGGSHPCAMIRSGCGIIYALTTSGTETILHDFAGGTDGRYPTGALTEMNGSLYGVTEQGGGGSGNCYYTRSSFGGCGTIFTIAPIK
jgi:uncharacterized repeat protein (TIGR03803 family)